MNAVRRRRTYREAQRSRQYRAARAYLWFCVCFGIVFYIARYCFESARQMGLVP